MGEAGGPVPTVSGLIHVDHATLRAHIRRALDSDQDLPIAGAFLFGSVLGPCRPDSDVDIGLVPLPHVPVRRLAVEGRAEQLLGTFMGHVFDPNLLEEPLLAYEAVTTGRLVYARDEDAVWDFVERAARLGWEVNLRYRASLRLLVDALRA